MREAILRVHISNRSSRTSSTALAVARVAFRGRITVSSAQIAVHIHKTYTRKPSPLLPWLLPTTAANEHVSPSLSVHVAVAVDPTSRQVMERLVRVELKARGRTAMRVASTSILLFFQLSAISEVRTRKESWIQSWVDLSGVSSWRSSSLRQSRLLLLPGLLSRRW